MRPVLHGDVADAARALQRLPDAIREVQCLQLFQEAEAADAYATRHGLTHPQWGNGSLMSAARKRVLSQETGFDDPEYCACFEMVLRLLAEWRVSQPRN